MKLNLLACSYSLSVLADTVTDPQVPKPLQHPHPGLSLSESNHSSSGCLGAESALQPESRGMIKTWVFSLSLGKGLGSLGVRGCCYQISDVQ